MPRKTTSKSGAGKTVDPRHIIDEIGSGLRRTAEDVVPWFLGHMEQMYFQDTDRATQLSHMAAIIAARASGLPMQMTLRADDDSRWTVMWPENRPGILSQLMSEIPDDRPLRGAKIHSAGDNSLLLVTFEFGAGDRFDPEDPKQARKLTHTIEYAERHAPHWQPEQITDYFHRCTAEYVMTLTPLRLCKHWEVCRRLSGTDGVEVTVESEAIDPNLSRIVIAAANENTHSLVARVATRLAHSRVNIQRAYLDIIDDSEHGAINFLGFVVQSPDGGPVDPESALWREIHDDLRRLKWIDPRVLELAYEHDDLWLRRAEVLVALGHLAHQTLVKRNPVVFNRERIVVLASRYLSVARAIVELFLDRFDPENPLNATTFAERVQDIRQLIPREADGEDARAVLHEMLNAVEKTLRTNVYLDGRYALSMRIDPSLLVTEDRPEVPHGVFFVHGRHFNGFHVRFRDIARGGVRAIVTRSIDQHSSEAERIYDEAYGLAFAQQLKNKDIPEGGSKAAVLLEPNTPVSRSVKAFVDALLDLITPDESTRRRIVDHLGEDELLYLGPDENITPTMINWIVERARVRGYSVPTALMSSKPGAGINHKDYGVTSEGVTVFLDAALRHIGIDPKTQPFTVKITGGPDGDVAGNEIKILHRDYGENARIVGIADGSGSGEDPDGLDHQELLRLVADSLPIADFSRDKLGPNGRVVSVDEPDGVRLRNTLHNRIVADAFVPAGGRPATIHEDNWERFLTEDGPPSSPLVVEGANLFLTPQARRKLASHGVLIIKDSSANKCGVICSSFEIAACMVLEESEFLAIKEIFVAQVLDKLRVLAGREADLLIRLYQTYPEEPLTDMSIRLSRVMIRAADAIEKVADDLDEEMRRRIVGEHLPPILVETAGDRLWAKMPAPYLRWIVAKSLATRIVYREGIEYLESVPGEAIGVLARRYLQAESERLALIDEVTNSNLANRVRVAEVLSRAGILPTLEAPES